ncbi:MAG TPA: hypothetical protein VJ576_17535 [Rhodocyclaceae bacterium]|nr:hypothetical protein [Rhodocyclaceae bacterium]
MKPDDFKPTLRARLQTTARLIDQEAAGLGDYVRERDRKALMELLQAGWREVTKIKARAVINAILEDRRARRQSN